MDHRIGIEAFDCRIAVISNCARTLANLDRFLFPSLPRIAPDVPGADIVLRILRREDGFQLTCGDRNEPARDFTALVREAVRQLDDGIVKRLTNLTAVHAGTVELHRKALLLPGKSHVGKSALVAELLRRGAIYFSDEYALIDERGRAHPYPRPLLLRNGGAEQVPVLPEECNARVGGGPVPVGWILALEYGPAASWRIGAVPQSEALLILLRNTPHELQEAPRILPALSRAASRSCCYTGQRGGAPEAAERILRLVEG
jgi:hypothetical protein